MKGLFPDTFPYAFDSTLVCPVNHFDNMCVLGVPGQHSPLQFGQFWYIY